METKRRLGILNIAVLLMLLMLLFPFYVVVINSFKTLQEMTTGGIFRMPTTWTLDNYIYAFQKMAYPTAFRNTLVIELAANGGMILFGSMTGYWLIRRPTRVNRIIYHVLLGALAIPFQAIMIPVVRVMRGVGLHGGYTGLTIAYWGMTCSTVIFLTYGAIKSIPYEIEEAGIIDGCSQLGLFFRIIFPLLRTIVLTFTILNVFYVWNDYLMPSILLGNRKELFTIQIALKAFSGEITVRWDYLLPGVILAMIPPVTLFIVCQRRIIDGMVSGAVKG